MRLLPELYDNANFVLGEGPVPCGLMLVGEAPGMQENELQRPFVGRAGEILNQALLRAGRPRKLVRITNAVKQRPPKNRKPTWDEILKHRFYLLQEIRECQPKSIVALGVTATQALLGEEFTPSLAQMRKKLAYYCGARLFPTYHPMATSYNPLLKPLFEEDLQRSVQWLNQKSRF